MTRHDSRPTPASGALLLRSEKGHATTEPELRESLDCEMCGTPVMASHCKRICLRCGFMTGCSEGI